MRSRLILIFAFLCDLALAQGRFGVPGRDGFDGRNGRSGYSGNPIVVFADGTQQSYDTSGSDGSVAEDGERGGDARSCYQRMAAQNERGSDGGSGGNGGIGGFGGSAGNVTVHYDDEVDLRMIRVDAEPGRGGRGGYGAWGGMGCRCQVRQWVVNGNTFYCDDGRNGRNGRSGLDGAKGREASVQLIPQMAPLPAERNRQRPYLSELVDGPVAVSEHVWSKRTGARALFASGSRIPDAYTRYEETFEGMVSMDWLANRSPSEFPNLRVGLNVDNRMVSTDVSYDYWLESSVTRVAADAFVLEVSKALHLSEVDSLSLSGFDGSLRSFNVYFQDPGGQGELLDTKVFLKYYTRDLLWNTKRFEGWIPPELVSYSGMEYVVNVGMLPIKTKYLKSGKKIYLEFVIRRSTESHELDIKVERNHEI